MTHGAGEFGAWLAVSLCVMYVRVLTLIKFEWERCWAVSD